MEFQTMKMSIKCLTPTELRDTINSLQKLLHSNAPINVIGMKRRIQALQAALKDVTKCHSSASVEVGDAKAMTKLGAKVAECRAKATPSLSRQKLSEMLIASGLNLSPQDVAEIEEGKRYLNYFQISILASVLNTSVYDLNA